MKRNDYRKVSRNMQAIEAIDRKIAKVTRELTNTNGSHLGKTPGVEQAPCQACILG